MTIGNTADVLPRLEAGELDVVLVTLPVPAGRVLSTPRLLSDPLVALLPEANAPADDAPITAPQIGQLPLILYEAGGNTRAVIDAWFRHAGITPRPVLELGSVEAIKTLVRSGLGAAVLPALALRGGVPGAVVRKLRPAVSRDLGYVLHQEKVMDRGLQLLLSELRLSVSEQAER